MPFQRPTLTDLKSEAAADVSAALPGSDPLLRFSNLAIMAKVQAGLANGHYGYLDRGERSADVQRDQWRCSAGRHAGDPR
jgi:hypothetical protein